ncbi:TonB-dependent receptor [Sphingosinicellaceae bacterium]|nr:TonB-dependent receptor [Sphingosinicellaceae bacterium]
MGRRKTLGIHVVIGAAALTAQSAVAQGIAVDNPAGDEIVVSAQKRTERLRDVPASISVLSGDMLEATGARSLADFATYIPGLAVNSGGTPGKTSIVLRGISTGSGGALVGTYIDETPLGTSSGFARGSSFQLDLLPYDIERLEVLRGPQGTLYGASTMGGLLKYVLRAADPSALEARAGGGIESVASSGRPGWGARAMINVPIVADTLAVRVSGFYQDNAGWIDNPARGIRNENSSVQKGARAALFWRASDRLAIKASALLQDIRSDGNAAVQLDAGTLQPTIGRYSRAHVLAEPYDQKLRFYSVTADWDVDFATVTSASSWSRSRNISIVDESALYGPLFPLFDPAAPAGGLSAFTLDVKLNKFTQELRIASSTSDHFEWLVGGFYTNENVLNRQALSAQNADRTPIASLDPFATVYWPTSYREYAAFGNATYKFSPVFDVTGGIRFSHNSQDYVQDIDGPVFGGFSRTALKSSDDVTTWSASARFRPDARSTFYARVASGYRPGGPNAPLIGAPASYVADTLTNYEVGYKGAVLDGLVDFDFSAFYVDWSDIQVPITLPTGSSTANGGKASSRGFEATIQARPSDGLRVAATASYTDAHLDGDVPALGARDGDRLPDAARWTASLSAEYRFPLGGSKTLTAAASYRFRGSSLTGLESIGSTIRIPAQSIVDANLGLTIGSVTGRVFIRNLINERAYTTFFDPDAGSSTLLVPVQPRTVGLSLDTRF